jgi:hypothetical protein
MFPTTVARRRPIHCACSYRRALRELIKIAYVLLAVLMSVVLIADNRPWVHAVLNHQEKVRQIRGAGLQCSVALQHEVLGKSERVSVNLTLRYICFL